MGKKQERAVRDYLTSLRDPSALRDDKAIAGVQSRLDKADDGLERLRLRQQLLDLERPAVDGVEAAFVEHAKTWADGVGISGDAFVAEGVPAAVLRRAGFRVSAGRAARDGRASGRVARGRRRVNAEDVRSAIPTGPFTVNDLQERSGASAAVVRRIIREEIAAGRLTDKGTSSDHRGPGRAPAVYERA